MSHRACTSVVVLIGLTGLAMAVVLVPSASTAQHSTATTLTRVAVIDLPGPSGRRFDYLTIDDDDHYLFSAHLAAGQLYVIDLRTHTVVKTIGLPLCSVLETLAGVTEGPDNPPSTANTRQ